MGKILINDYDDANHFKYICESDYDVSRTGEYITNDMRHIHNSCEILIIEEGAVEYYVNGKRYLGEANDIIIIGAMENHIRKIITLPYIRYGLTIHRKYISTNIIDDDLVKCYKSPTEENYYKFYKNKEKDFINELIHNLELLKEEEKGKKDFKNLKVKSIILEISIMLFRELGITRSNKIASTQKSTMLLIKEYIDINFDKEINLKILSEKFYLHPTTISKEFKKTFNYTITNYLNLVRICEATNLLESYDDSVSEIAYKCGYLNLNTFLRQFKAIMETSPLQYKKSLNKWLKTSKLNKKEFLEQYKNRQ